jgi:hypothetical protein
MPFRMAQSMSAWTEDTALQRCNRSADPGAKTEARTVSPALPSGFYPCFGIGPQAKNLRGTTPRNHDTMSPTQLNNTDHSEFHFPLNQDIRSFSIS